MNRTCGRCERDRVLSGREARGVFVVPKLAAKGTARAWRGMRGCFEWSGGDDAGGVPFIDSGSAVQVGWALGRLAEERPRARVCSWCCASMLPDGVEPVEIEPDDVPETGAGRRRVRGDGGEGEGRVVGYECPGCGAFSEREQPVVDHYESEHSGTIFEAIPVGPQG